MLRADRRERIVDAIAIVVAHLCVCLIVLAGPFDHVSDDDFARITIAQTFAIKPSLDPSGTSWLPFPFWWTGTAMMVFGRSLLVARAANLVLSSLAATLPYLALRRVDVGRAGALLATLLAFVSPWALWLGAATVPESFVASATTAAAIALGRRSANDLFFALPLAAACLSRYEPWPVAAMLAIVTMVRARDPSRFVVPIVLALAPLGWIAWNAIAHGSAFHFFHRVAMYKRAIGEGATDTLAALLFFPRLLLTMRPELTFGCIVGAFVWRRTTASTRWLVPLGCVLAELAFLAYGNARDGAPAHHPERSLLGTTFILATFVGDTVANVFTRASRSFVAGIALLTAGWLADRRAFLRFPPGSSPSEDRAPQIEEGQRLAREKHGRIAVVPCAYEHFALIAAFGAPEAVEVQPSSGTPVTPVCPQVILRR